jgi:hypothetical protein
MEMTYFTLILCAALLVGLGLPGLIYFSSRRKKGINEYDVFTRLMKKYRQAWTADQDEMQELSRKVELILTKRTQDSGSAGDGRSGSEVSKNDKPGHRS